MKSTSTLSAQSQLNAYEGEMGTVSGEKEGIMTLKRIHVLLLLLRLVCSLWSEILPTQNLRSRSVYFTSFKSQGINVLIISK